MSWGRGSSSSTPKFTFEPTIRSPPLREPSSSSTSTTQKTPPHCVSVKKASLVPRGYKSFEEWNADPDHVYIGRNMNHYVPGAVGSKWQNPYKSQKYGLAKCLEMYEAHVRSSKELFDSLIELEGKEIGCWCKPSGCHGDVLVKLFAQLYCS